MPTSKKIKDLSPNTSGAATTEKLETFYEPLVKKTNVTGNAHDKAADPTMSVPASAHATTKTASSQEEVLDQREIRSATPADSSAAPATTSAHPGADDHDGFLAALAEP